MRRLVVAGKDSASGWSIQEALSRYAEDLHQRGLPLPDPQPLARTAAA